MANEDAEPAFGHDIDLPTQQLFEILTQPDEIEERAPLIHYNEQVEVRCVKNNG